MKRMLFILGLLLAAFRPSVGLAAVVPSAIELSGNRGEAIESSFWLLNTNESEEVYYLDRLVFSPSDESGTPRFSGKETQPNGLVAWIDFPSERITVPAQSKVDVPFSVTIPHDVASGGYYAAMTISTAPTDIVEANGAVIEAKTAVLVLLTVEGDTTEKLELLDFTFDQEDPSLPFGTFQFRLQNQGNVHVIPSGEIRIKGLLGQTIAVLGANASEGRVLPSSTRMFTVSFEESLTWMEAAGYQLSRLALGPLKAELVLSYPSDETVGTIRASTNFMIVPWQLLVTLVATGLLMLGLYRKLPKRSK